MFDYNGIVELLVASESVENNVWLGLSDKETEGVFIDANTGEEIALPSSFTIGWGANQPNTTPDYDCIIVDKEFPQYFTDKCLKSHPYVCEYHR